MLLAGWAAFASIVSGAARMYASRDDRAAGVIGHLKTMHVPDISISSGEAFAVGIEHLISEQHMSISDVWQHSRGRLMHARKVQTHVCSLCLRPG